MSEQSTARSLFGLLSNMSTRARNAILTTQAKNIVVDVVKLHRLLSKKRVKTLQTNRRQTSRLLMLSSSA